MRKFVVGDNVVAVTSFELKEVAEGVEVFASNGTVKQLIGTFATATGRFEVEKLQEQAARALGLTTSGGAIHIYYR